MRRQDQLYFERLLTKVKNMGEIMYFILSYFLENFMLCEYSLFSL